MGLRFITRCRECFDAQDGHYDVLVTEGQPPTPDQQWAAFDDHKRLYHPELVK